MPITVIVRSAGGGDARLTFDGMQRVVIGRGASCDIRLPDASVSHRHACLGVHGVDFVVMDEGSTNGTFVGQVRIAPRTSRIVRSGDMVRVGSVWLELSMDQCPVTRDVAAATRDLALAIVSQAMAARGKDLTATVRVVEGADQGAALALADEGRAYILGRGAHSEILLSDGDASREHVCVTRRGSVVFVRDLGAKNGTWLGDARAPENHDVVWRPAQMMRIGRTVLALEEPVGDALARIESAPDQALPVDEPIAPPQNSIATTVALSKAGRAAARKGDHEATNAGPIAEVPPPVAVSDAQPLRGRFSIADMMVMATAVGVLALSIAGLVWLLRG
jgi:pSer/pThr/pTyr-binding forkhead associated (FHA) protein